MRLSWYERSAKVIREVHAQLPPDATLAERKKALQDAYPFGSRENHPYKQWCKAQRDYLARYDQRPVTDGLFALARGSKGELR